MVTRITGAAFKAVFFLGLGMVIVIAILVGYLDMMRWIAENHTFEDIEGSYLLRYPEGAPICLIARENLNKYYVDRVLLEIDQFDRQFDIGIGSVSVYDDTKTCDDSSLIIFLLDKNELAISELETQEWFLRNQLSLFEVDQPALTSVAYSYKSDKIVRIISIEMDSFNISNGNSNYLFGSFLTQELFHAFSFGHDAKGLGFGSYDSILQENVFEQHVSVKLLYKSEHLFKKFTSSNSNRLCKKDYLSMYIIYAKPDEFRILSWASLRILMAYIQGSFSYVSEIKSGRNKNGVTSNHC